MAGRKIRRLYYCGLESYVSRYTYQLEDWSTRVFKARGIDYEIVRGDNLTASQDIVTGQVLDAHGRSYYSLTQMANLVKLLKAGSVTSEDVIFFEDMFTPGIEMLPYIIDQTPAEYRPRIFVRCLAQSIDPDDFVHVWGMARWMGLYEQMVNEFATVLATNEEMVAHMRIAGWRAPIYNISGLSFGKQEVMSRVEDVKPFDERAHRVVFAARFDQEKQPNFYMDLIEEWFRRYPNDIARVQNRKPVEFAVLSGGTLRSNDPVAVVRAREMEQEGLLKIYENLEKNDYYNIVNDSRVLFNCALQDWVSNTVSEADSLGCNVLYPAYRSFPETFANDPERLYIPWSQDDAINKLTKLLAAEHPNQGSISDWNNGTIDRMIDIMEGHGEQWLRDWRDYRAHVAAPKYGNIR
jgi:hypothetical protein